MSIEVRSARPDDLDRICEIVAEALEEEDADEARLVLEDPAFDRDRWLVGLVDGEIASTLALIDAEARLGETTFPVGQIEFVATAETARGRGLIRAQLDEAHRRSAAAGHLMQLIVGIPHFYRQFGYGYPMRVPPYQAIGPEVGLTPGDWSVRLAGTVDVPAIRNAQAAAQAEAAVAISHPEYVWRWFIESPNYDVVVAESRDQLAVGRIYLDGETAYLGDVVAPTRAALHALITHARKSEPTVAVMHRAAGLLSAMLTGLGMVLDEHGWYYGRIGDVPAMLDTIRPVLEQRLAASPLDGFSGTFVLSWYRESVRCDIADGRLGPMEAGGPVAYPVSAGGSGVPDDLIPRLLFGPFGAGEMERSHGDVLLGEQAELMHVLFPPVTSDVQTWVFP